MRARGQIALEFLLVWAAELGALALLLAGGFWLLELGSLSLDAAEAKSFGNALGLEAQSLVSTNGFGRRPWSLFCHDRWELELSGNGKLDIVVFSGALSRTVSFDWGIPSLPFSMTIHRRARLVSTVDDGVLSIVALDG